MKPHDVEDVVAYGGIAQTAGLLAAQDVQHPGAGLLLDAFDHFQFFDVYDLHRIGVQCLQQPARPGTFTDDGEGDRVDGEALGQHEQGR